MRYLLLAAFLAAATPAFGRWSGVGAEQVPVSRLIENLETITKNEPNSVEALLNLGRAHSMAYAQKADPLVVQTSYRKLALSLVPSEQVVPAADAGQKALAQAHLEAALKAYKRAQVLDKNDLVVRLGLAWLTEQAGETREAVKQYRAIAADAWEKKEKTLEHLGLAERTLTAEIASYLLPLLDAQNDKAEIQTLNERVSILEKLPRRPVTPIAVPLTDELTATDLEAPDARVTFDVDGSGLDRAWSWITPKAAWLVYDPTAEGKISSGLQLFGNVTFWMFWSNGYASLAALDDDRDGILIGKELDGLALWHDANGNGVADPGEVKPLSAYGIVALSCKWQTLTGHPNKIAFSPAGVKYKDGTTRPTFDLLLKAKPRAMIASTMQP